MAWATAAAIVTAIGAGVSAYSSYQAGKTQDYMAELNAAQQERNARNQLMAMQTQANLAKREAEANLRLRSVEAQGRFNNATSIENQQRGQDAIDRLNLRKKREEYEAFAASQRARIASSGVVESSGSNLENIAELARVVQLDQAETHYGNLQRRSTIFREAELERLGGKAALAGATLDRDSAMAAATLSASAGRSEYLSRLRGAEVERIGGRLAAKAGAVSAGATLFSGLGQSAGYFVRS